MNKPSRLVVSALLLGLVACTQPGVRGGVAGGVDEARIDAILADVKAATELGESGLAAHAAGDADRAAQALNGAREGLAAAAGRCVATPGCELERVLAAQDALVARQTEVLLGALQDRERVEDAVPGEEVNEEAESPLLSQVPQSQRSVALLKGQDLRRIIDVNEPVRAALEEWLTWMRPFLLEAHENYQFMRHRMWPEYEKAGLPEALLFGILAKESGGQGARGVARRAPSGRCSSCTTPGGATGWRSRTASTSASIPAAATRANVAYMNDHLRIFNNNLELVLGAYNGGEGRMQRLSGKGARSFWDPQVFIRAAAGNPRLRADGAGRGVAVPASGGIQPALPGGRRAAGRGHAGARDVAERAGGVPGPAGQ